MLIYTADGYMSGAGVAEGRTAPTGTAEKLNEERAKLFVFMAAYAGRYTVEPDRVIHHVEAAWNPAWKGTDQIRYVAFEGETIRIRTPVIVSAVDGRKRTFTLHLRRVKWQPPYKGMNRSARLCPTFGLMVSVTVAPTAGAH